MQTTALIVGFILDMIPFALIGFAAVAIYRYVTKKDGVEEDKSKVIAVYLLVAYLAGLAAITVVPNMPLDPLFELRGEINLIPFRIFLHSWEEWQVGNTAYFVISLLGNIIIFVPLGAFASYLSKAPSLKKAALWGLLVSVVIEISQLPQERYSDIDDLWLNALGAAIGYYVWRFYEKKRAKTI